MEGLDGGMVTWSRVDLLFGLFDLLVNEGFPPVIPMKGA